MYMYCVCDNSPIALLLGFPSYTNNSAGTAILGVPVVDLVALLNAAILIVL